MVGSRVKKEKFLLRFAQKRQNGIVQHDENLISMKNIIKLYLQFLKYML